MIPGLAQLETTPELFRIIFEGLTTEEAHWKPSPDRWSIAEVIEHLAHVEGHGFRARIDQMLGDAIPDIKEYDQEVYSAAGQYAGREIEDSFDHWEDQRESNVEFLQGLQDDVASRQGRHERLGMITIGELMNEWAFHDMGHVRQVMELIRAQRYYPKLGPFQPLYAVHP